MDIQATQLRSGMIIKLKGDVFTVFSVDHRTPGNKRGFVQAKIRSRASGAMIEHRFSSEDFMEKVDLHEQEMEYLYEDGDYHFMNTENYEQISISKAELGTQVNYLVPNTTIKIFFHEGNPFSLNLPASVDLVIVETAPSIKGATATNVNKPATTETGLVVQVPPFIREGEKIRVSTSDGTYQSRA